MKQSTFSAVMANKLLTVLQGYTKGIRFVAVLIVLLTISIGQAWGAEGTATLSFANKAQRTSFSTTKQVWEQNGVTFTNDKASSTNNIADYANPVRLYASSSVTVECSLGNMTKIVFNANTTGYATALKNSIGNAATVISKAVTVNLDGTSNTFTVAKLTAQVRLDNISVTYATAATATEYNITYAGDDHITYTGTKPETITKEDSGFELEFSVNDGYQLNDVQVKMGGQNLVVEDDYYWEEGYLLILPETDITGDIEIIFETVATCTAPTITTQPTGATYTKGATATALKVVASGDDLTYQWYSNTSDGTSGATQISDATSFTYTPSTSTAGTKYYYCIVSSGSCSTPSNIVSVVVKNPPFTVTLNAGSGSCAASVAESSAGAGVDLPTPTICDGWTFAGWAMSAVATETSSKPATLLTGTYKPTSNITLYAVYQRTEETEGNGGTENVSSEYTFSDYTAGTQYAVDEVHKLDDVLTLTTTQCHFTSELRIYSSDAHNGYVVSNQLPGRIISIDFNAGYKFDNIAVYGSTNGTAWTKVGQVSVTSTSYANYSLSFGETNYTYFKLDVEGSNQVRLKSITITWESTTSGGTSSTTYYHSTPDCGTPEPLPTYTITWMANGLQHDSQTDEEGTAITLPSNPDAANYACDGKVFVGWTATEIDGNTDIEPADLFNTINEAIASDKTFYAVFAKPETVGSAETTVTTTISAYADKNYWENATQYQSVVLDDNITATAEGGGNTGKYYESGETWRLYKSENATITIAASNGCTINTVTITYDSDKNGVLLNAGTQVASGDEITVNAESLTLGTGVSSGTESGQVRITQISVTYTSIGGGSTSTYSNYVTTCDNTEYTLTLIDRGVRTEQATKYHAGETIDEAPAAPTGVCTDPINYVFYGWTTEEIATSASSCTKVSFPYTVTGDTEFYAVYRWNESNGGDGDYHLVEEDMDDWSGDYLIAYSDAIFANGSEGGKEGIGASGTHVDLSSLISNKSIPHEEGDKYNVTLESTTDGYLMLTKDGQYNYHTTNTGNGLSNSESKTVAEKYPITVTFVSSENIQLTVAGGAVFQYNPDQQGYFRFYKNGGQKSVHLYKKTSGTSYYTTSPICGPHMEITAGKDIYVTGGIGTRNVVIASQKVSYVATRLNDNGGNAPAITATSSNSEVIAKVDNDAVITLQPDGTYTISGTITVTYIPTSTDKTADVQVQLNVENNAEATNSFTVHARSLPQEFVIVAKQGDKWYALNADMSGSTTQLANGQVTLDNAANPTKATYAPCNAIYSFEALPNSSKADRTSVRFVGLEGKYLWAASDGNTGIQNYSKDPAGDATAYNWKLYTTDHITYQMGNGQNTRLLGLNSSLRFGMYSSVAGLVNDIRILPYVEKCVYNQAPSNLKITDLKGTYVTLVWDAIAGATKYQYSTDATNWIDCGTEPTVTINGLTGNEEYTYYIRAYHEDAGVNQVCIDYSEITFTTANCDNVPSNLSYSSDLSTITISWASDAATSTVKLYSDKEGTTEVKSVDAVSSPHTFTELPKNTVYYAQVFGGGDCPSQIILVRTKDVEMDVVEWKPDSIVVDINTNEKISVTLANEVQYGTGSGNKAEDIFFSKYFEANGTAKILAIYNGTDQKIDITNITILNDLSSQSLSLETFGRQEEGYIYPGEEIILFNKGTEAVTDCSEKQEGYENWYNVEHGVLSFGGRATIILQRGDEVIDIIGSIKTTGANYPNDLEGTTIYNIGKKTTEYDPVTEKPSWGDDPGWVCENGDNIMTDIVETDYGLSTNRCLLVRKNTVVSGVNAVENNRNKAFATLCEEWIGLQIPKNAPSTDEGVTESCEGMAFVGGFDYAGYYTKYEIVGGAQEFDESQRNEDGTIDIAIPELYKQACRNIQVTITDANGAVIMTEEYKVPIMITAEETTDGQTFLALQKNLATKVDDGHGGITDKDLTYEEVLEICKTCDVVIRDNATLCKAADDAENDHPEVRNIYVYEGASLVIPDGTNYTINSLSLRRREDAVSSIKVEGTDNLHLPASAAAPISLTLRVDAQNWHWFTLPYNCNIADVTWVDGTPAQYNKDWFIMYYDGNSRANEQSIYENHWKVYNGTTIEAGKGYIVGIQGDITHPNHTFELRFPMAAEVLTHEHTDKHVAVNAWGVNMDITPNKKGWNLVGNPYLDYYKTSENISFKGLSLIKYEGIDPVTGDRLYDDRGTSPFLVTPVDGGWYEYQQELASDVEMMPFTAYFVQVGDPANASHTDGMELHAKFVSDKRGRMSLIRRAPQEVDGEQEPVIVRVEVANAKGESDKTTLIIDDRFTNEYEMNADFFKWFGDYYRRYTKPVLYSIGADAGKRAFNALSEQLAAQPIPLGMFAAQAGDYTFTLTRKRCDLSSVEEVWLYDATNSTYTNLMQQDYTFTTAKTEGEGRFYLSVKMRQNAPTDITDIYGGNIVASAKDGQIIVSGLTDNTQLWIYDATGKLLYTEQTTNFQHVYEVPVVGTYFVRTLLAGQAQTIKVLVE